MINNNICFHFQLFPRKTNDKIFQNIQKKLILGPFWVLFPKIWQKEIFLEKKALLGFEYSNNLSLCKKSEKTNKNCQTDGRTDRQTDKQLQILKAKPQVAYKTQDSAVSV